MTDDEIRERMSGNICRCALILADEADRLQQKPAN
jgi:aerobic-type carbon monoxide dehydrogenase small subunit (CoxS/CutS family)